MPDSGLEALLEELKATTSNQQLLDWATEATRQIELLRKTMHMMLDE